MNPPEAVTNAKLPLGSHLAPMAVGIALSGCWLVSADATNLGIRLIAFGTVVIAVKALGFGFWKGGATIIVSLLAISAYVVDIGATVDDFIPANDLAAVTDRLQSPVTDISQ